MILIVFLIGLVIVFGVWLIIQYNRFIKLQERVANDKTQIESRWDAIKNLITANKTVCLESEVLEKLRNNG